MPDRQATSQLDRALFADSLRIALIGGCGHCDTEPDEMCAACGSCRCDRHDDCKAIATP
jgi:hypothetical protein